MAMEPVPDRDQPDRNRIDAGRGRRTAIRQIRAAAEEPPTAADQGPVAGGSLPMAADPAAEAQSRAYAQGGRASGIWHPRLPGRKPPKLVRGRGVTVHGQIEDWLADAIATGRRSEERRVGKECRSRWSP